MAGAAEDPTVTAKAPKEEENKESATAAVAEDEDTGAQVAPIVKLEEVTVTTGEENEEVLLDLKAKLYRFDNEGNQWKERGVGVVKLLRHRDTGIARIVMRQSKTLKICANHRVRPTITIQKHAGNDKSCLWHAADFADGELKEETFAIRFATVENCKAFKEKIMEIAESLDHKAGDGEDAAAAKLIDQLSVTEEDKGEKPESKTTLEKTDGDARAENREK